MTSHWITRRRGWWRMITAAFCRGSRWIWSRSLQLFPRWGMLNLWEPLQQPRRGQYSRGEEDPRGMQSDDRRIPIFEMKMLVIFVVWGFVTVSEFLRCSLVISLMIAHYKANYFQSYIKSQRHSVLSAV